MRLTNRPYKGGSSAHLGENLEMHNLLKQQNRENKLAKLRMHGGTLALANNSSPPPLDSTLHVSSKGFNPALRSS